jgi:glycosyltransferase involved in cell wall biosynthesis
VRVCIVGPVNLVDLVDLLDPAHRAPAAQQPRHHGTAPGQIARALHARGHEVSLVTAMPGMPAESFSGARLTIRRIDGRTSRLRHTVTRWSAQVSAMREAILGLAPDVVHSNWAYEAGLAAARSGLPHVATVRDAPLTVLRWYPRPDRWVRATLPYELRIRYGHSSVVTAVSPYLAHSWRRQTRWPSPVEVIPNIAPGAPAQPTTEQVDAHRATFVEVADDEQRKNVATLLRAFALVRRTHPEARLVVMGRGLDASGPTAALARRDGLDAGVEFLGPRGAAEVALRLRMAVAHVHCAREETFGNTLVEAMSAGTPVIGGRASGAVPWVLGSGRAGVLVDVRDPAAVAAAMRRLADDPAERARLSAAGLREVERFAASRVSELYEGAYRRAIALGSRAAER